MKIVVTIPTYNEKENIEKTILTLEESVRSIKEYEIHILVIDDTSPDGTAEVVREMIKTHPRLHILVRKTKSGLGAAYLAGWDYAFYTMKADAVISFDADLSHDPNVMPEFIKHYQNGAKYVCGTRYRKGGGIPPEWGIHRKILSSFSNMFVRILYFETGMSDFTSGYKMISREVYDVIRDKLGLHKGYTFALSSNLESMRSGYELHEVPYHFKDRTVGKSKMGPEYMLNAFVFVIKSRVQDIFNSRFGKVMIAGALGSIAQFISFGLIFKPLIEDGNVFNISSINGYDPTGLLAVFLSIEVGIFVAFSVNNLWAFKDHKLSGFVFWLRFLKNQLVVAGAIVIQLLIFQSLAWTFGRSSVLDYVYQAIGILIGLIWNFYFYKKIIWKVSKNKEQNDTK